MRITIHIDLSRTKRVESLWPRATSLVNKHFRSKLPESRFPVGTLAILSDPETDRDN